MGSAESTLASVNTGTVVRRKALSIGINYIGTDNELNGCVNDSHSMLNFFRELGYPEDRILYLNDLDFDQTSPRYPNKENILKAIQWLTTDDDTEAFELGYSSGQPLQGKAFFHYSGHGSQILARDTAELDGMDEVIVPVDFDLVTDNELRNIFTVLGPGQCLQVLMDCCNSGTNLDLPYTMTATRFSVSPVKKDSYLESRGLIQQFSAVKDHQYASDLPATNLDPSMGAMTKAFLQIVRSFRYQGTLKQLTYEINRRMLSFTRSPDQNVVYSSGNNFRSDDMIYF